MSESTVVSHFKRWTPKKWKPLYTEIVALYAAGQSHEEIATAKGITKQTVSNVVCTPQAKLILRQISDKLIKASENTIESNLSIAAAKAAERIRDYIANDDLYTNAPGPMVDRSMRILAKVGKMKDDVPNVTQGNGGNTFNVGRMLVLSAESAKEITDAIALSKQVDDMHGAPGLLSVGTK